MKLLRNEDGYSFYENPDKDLVEKIKLVPKPKYVTIGWGEESEGWELSNVMPNGKYLMTSKTGDLKTVSKEDYEESVKEAHLELINRTFLVSDVFNKYVAPFQNATSEISEMTTQLLRHESFYSGVNGVFIKKQWDAYHSTVYNNYNFSVNDGIYSGHMYFTENGEICNRDYNQDFNILNNFESLDKTKEKYLSFFKNLPEKLEYSREKWFTNEFVLLFVEGKEKSLTIFKYPNQGTGYYNPGESRNKILKPKNLKIVEKTHFIEFIKYKLAQIN